MTRSCIQFQGNSSPDASRPLFRYDSAHHFGMISFGLRGSPYGSSRCSGPLEGGSVSVFSLVVDYDDVRERIFTFIIMYGYNLTVVPLRCLRHCIHCIA
jgi:hypothetical protein